MFNTLIPLDIAFADAEGKIVAIRHMLPCTYPIGKYCPQYAPETPFRFALEVNGGFFAGHQIDVGDTILIPD